MNRPRTIVPSDEEEARYHCISRTVGRAFLFGEEEKEKIRREIWLLAEYCGVEVISYVVMSNHYHVLLNVPKRRDVSDEELLRLYRKVYPKLTAQKQRQLEKVQSEMPGNGPSAVRWRERQKLQMFDVSHFNKRLKERVSRWYNKRKNRTGTLWEAPFKSQLTEEGEGTEVSAAYIDLNPARAGIVEDPKDYRFCCYAEAVAGSRQAQEALGSIYHAPWKKFRERYRCLLFGTGSERMTLKGRISKEAFEEVRRRGGRLPLCVVLRCRTRYIVDGGILGSYGYVAQQAAKFLKRQQGKSQAREPYEMDPVTDWKGLTVYSRMRSKLFA